MPTKASKKLSTYRRRLRRHGIVRVEVNVRRDDAALVRWVVRALNDPHQGPGVQHLLRERFGIGKCEDLKDLLAVAPLEGINLERDSNYGRDIEL